MVHLILLCALFLTFPDLNKKYPFWIYTFTILFFFSALRYDYGSDYMEYYNIHTAINAGLPSWGQNDILFKYLNLVIPNFYILIALLSLFYTITIYYLIKNNLKVKQYWFAILLLLINPYLFLVQLSSIRQTIAICFFIIAINFATKRKPLIFIFFIAIASGFHASALALLPIYLILNESKLKKRMIISLCILIIILIATPLFEIISNHLLGYFPRHYETYFEQGLQNTIRSTVIGSFFFFFVLVNINKLKGNEMIYGKLALISTFISIMAYKVSMITRIGMYFDIFLIVALPIIFSRIKTKAYSIIMFAIMLLIYLLRYYSFFKNPNWSRAYEIYETILSKLLVIN